MYSVYNTKLASAYFFARFTYRKFWRCYQDLENVLVFFWCFIHEIN